MHFLSTYKWQSKPEESLGQSHSFASRLCKFNADPTILRLFFCGVWFSRYQHPDIPGNKSKSDFVLYFSSSGEACFDPGLLRQTGLIARRATEPLIRPAELFWRKSLWSVRDLFPNFRNLYLNNQTLVWDRSNCYVFVWYLAIHLVCHIESDYSGCGAIHLCTSQLANYLRSKNEVSTVQCASTYIMQSLQTISFFKLSLKREKTPKLCSAVVFAMIRLPHTETHLDYLQLS